MSPSSATGVVASVANLISIYMNSNFFTKNSIFFGRYV